MARQDECPCNQDDLGHAFSPLDSPSLQAMQANVESTFRFDISLKGTLCAAAMLIAYPIKVPHRRGTHPPFAEQTNITTRFGCEVGKPGGKHADVAVEHRCGRVGCNPANRPRSS